MTISNDTVRPAKAPFTHEPFSRFYGAPLQAIMNTYYEKLAQLGVRKEQPVAWITTMVPIEIVHAAGIFPFYPENYSALCASRGLSDSLIQAAEESGLSRDLCGYATCNIGSVLSDTWAFGKGGVPKPDLLIASRLTCNIHLNWWTYLSHHFQVPLFIIDAPYRPAAAYQPEDVAYFIAELKKLVQFLGVQTGRAISPDRLRQVLFLSDHASRFWSEISLSRRAVPSPLGSKDVFSLMFPMVTLAGTEEALKFYQEVAQEVASRMQNRVSGSPRETYRLIWDLFPPWHDMKVFQQFEKEGAVFVVDFYADAFSGRLDAPDPYQALAGKYLFNPSLQRGIGDKRSKIDRLACEFQLDGAVFMSNMSCRYFSLGQLDLARHLQHDLNLPVLIFEGDHMDPRRHNKITAAEAIQSFFDGILVRSDGRSSALQGDVTPCDA